MDLALNCSAGDVSLYISSFVSEIPERERSALKKALDAMHLAMLIV
jgi:hypothetical protein